MNLKDIFNPNHRERKRIHPLLKCGVLAIGLLWLLTACGGGYVYGPNGEIIVIPTTDATAIAEMGDDISTELAGGSKEEVTPEPTGELGEHVHVLCVGVGGAIVCPALGLAWDAKMQTVFFDYETAITCDQAYTRIVQIGAARPIDLVIVDDETVVDVDFFSRLMPLFPPTDFNESCALALSIATEQAARHVPIIQSGTDGNTDLNGESVYDSPYYLNEAEVEYPVLTREWVGGVTNILEKVRALKGLKPYSFP